LAKPECKGQDRLMIRMTGDMCTQGVHGGSTKYCYAQEVYASFMTDMNGLTAWDKTSDVSAYCVEGACTGKFMEAVLSGADDAIVAIWDVIGKYMCLTPPGATNTCWEATATLFAASGASPMDDMMQTPATFCADLCKRGLLLDLMNFQVTAAANQGAAAKVNAEAKATMIRDLMDFSCLQKEDDTYCISVAMNSVAIPNALDFNGDSMTKPVCKESTSGQDGENDDGGDGPNVKCDSV